MRSDDNLRAEYLLIQGQYEAFDERALSMKAMTTPLLGVGIALGAKDVSQALLLSTALVAALLWVLEAFWKVFQYRLIDRIRLLEDWFRGGGPDEIAPFQIYTAWRKIQLRRRIKQLLKNMLRPFIAFPYAAVIVIALSLNYMG